MKYGRSVRITERIIASSWLDSFASLWMRSMRSVIRKDEAP
jgi:hypothetical protein